MMKSRVLPTTKDGHLAYVLESSGVTNNCNTTNRPGGGGVIEAIILPGRSLKLPSYQGGGAIQATVIPAQETRGVSGTFGGLEKTIYYLKQLNLVMYCSGPTQEGLGQV